MMVWDPTKEFHRIRGEEINDLVNFIQKEIGWSSLVPSSGAIERAIRIMTRQKNHIEQLQQFLEHIGYDRIEFNDDNLSSEERKKIDETLGIR